MGARASSASDYVALQGRPVKGSFVVADAMAPAPPLAVLPLRVVFRQLSDEALLDLSQQPRRRTMAQTRFTCSLTTADEPAASRTHG